MSQSTEVVLSHEGEELLRVTLPEGTYIIGRSPEVQIFADTPLLSRQHALLTINSDHALIQDLDSRNGTFVGGEKITGETRLFSSQSIQLGYVKMELHRVRKTDAGTVGATKPPALVPELAPGEERYRVEEFVTQGGMGAILATRDVAIDRKVAMKVMLNANSEGDVARFVSEARVTAQLEHPNIVPVHELGVDEQEQVFYTMKFVRGITLGKVLDLIAEGRAATVQKYPLGSVLTVFQKLCDAIAFAHSRGVLHRDLKPENVMIGDYGEVLVMDWGLAKVLGQVEIPGSEPNGVGGISDSSRAGMTMAGTVMGTPQYMSPEQARGEVETLDARTDIYALGAILYQILSLRPPLTGTDSSEVVDRVARGDLDPLRPPERPDAKAATHLPNGCIPSSLTAIVRKAMALEPARRYATVTALQQDLAAYQNGFATSAEEAGLGTQLLLLVKRHRALTVALVAACALLGWWVAHVIATEREMKARLTELRETVPAFREQARLSLERASSDSSALATALEQLTQAVEIAPDDAENHAARGRVLQTMLRLGDARAAFERALELDPKLVTARVNLELDNAVGDGPQFTPAQLRRLQTGFLAQGRGAEAVVLGRAFVAGGESGLAKWRKVLREQRIDRPLTVDADGSLSLSLMNLPISDIGFLRGIPLSVLTLTRTKVTDLSPLAGMPLRRLFLSGTGVADLSPLRGMPLTQLEIGDSKVTDLSPIRGMPLESIIFAGMPQIKDWSILRAVPLKIVDLDRDDLRDLSFLRGMKLQSLYLRGNPIIDLTSLAGVQADLVVFENCKELTSAAGAGTLGLKEFSAWGAEKLADIEGLRGVPLETCGLSNTKVSDLGPLEGAPLRNLSIDGSQVKSFAPLQGMKHLQSLIAQHIPATDLTPLQGLTELHVLEIGMSQVSDLTPLRGLPIEQLRLDGANQLRDLSPIASLPRLTLLALPRPMPGLAGLSAIPTLRLILFDRPLPSESERAAAIQSNQAAGVLKSLKQIEQARVADSAYRIHPGSIPGFGVLFPKTVRLGKSWFALEITGRMSWSEAENEAELMGGHLACPDSAEKEAFLEKSYGVQFGTLWLGGVADKSKGTWRWLDGMPWSYAHWLPGEPNGAPAENEPQTRLALMKRPPGEQVGWNDFPENAPGITGYLIEWED